MNDLSLAELEKKAETELIGDSGITTVEIRNLTKGDYSKLKNHFVGKYHVKGSAIISGEDSSYVLHVSGRKEDA
tara:strand:- start:1348 stop:1569 length:222 start_codon:yes stop_codon:yes gene_type:complete